MLNILPYCFSFNVSKTMTVYGYEYSNKTKYGYGNDTERYTSAILTIFVIISSLIGDSTILIASIKYKAFKLHRIIVIIIQHIAVCDLTMAITVVFPILVNILANQWLFGYSFCNLTPYVSTYCSTAGILLISVMTMSKVLLVKYPLRFGSVSSKKEGYKLCASCWLVAVIMPATMLFTDSRNVYFSYRSYQCDYDFSREIWRSLLPVLSAVFLFIPTCIVVATTVNICLS